MRRHKGSASNRSARVAQQLHFEVAQILRGELKDPRIGMATVTDVELTADYAYLKVFVSILPDDAENVAQAMKGLQSAAGFVRSKIGSRVRIHTTPEIRFVHDRTTETAMEMSQLIDKALENQADDSPLARSQSDEPDEHGQA